MGGSHIILYNDKPGSLPLSIPDHRELAPGLLRTQIKRAGMTVEEFFMAEVVNDPIYLSLST